MLTKIIQLALFVSVAISMASCAIPIKAITTDPQRKATVPNDFEPERNVLLVMSVSQPGNENLVDMKSTIRLDKELQKQYPFAYKIVSQKELKDYAEKNPDTSAYRFVLVSQRRVVTQKGSFQLDLEEGLAFIPGYKATYVDFSFYDLLTKQRFPFSGTSTTDMKLAVKNLTQTITEFSKQKTKQKFEGNTAFQQAYSNEQLLLVR